MPILSLFPSWKGDQCPGKVTISIALCCASQHALPKGSSYGLVDLNTWSPKSGTVYQAYENFRKSQGGWIAEGSGSMCVGVGLEIHIVVPLSVLSLFSDSQGFESSQS